MLMPKAAVHENDLASRRKYQIRGTWEVAPVKTKTITQSMRYTSNAHFRLCVPTLDARHDAASGRGRNPVGHVEIVNFTTAIDVGLVTASLEQHRQVRIMPALAFVGNPIILV